MRTCLIGIALLHCLIIAIIPSIRISVVDAKRVRCHHTAFDNCFKSFFAFGKRADATRLATNAHGLDLFCGSFNKTMSCIDKHLKKCATPIQEQLWDMMSGQMQYEFREQICIDGPLRQNYLKHGDCIYEHVIGADDAIPCLNNYLLAFEHLTSDGRHNWHATICCAHKRKEKCTDQLALKNCGKEAEDAFRVFFDKIHFGFFSTVCNASNYDIESEQCKIALPNAGSKPKALKSMSFLSKMLYKNFPFNYVTKDKRNKKIKKKGKKKN